MVETSIDVPIFYAVINQTRQSQGLSWRGLAQRLGITPSTFTRMAQGRRPDSDTFAVLVAWLGMPAEDFLKRRDVASEDPDPMGMISLYLRSARNVRPEDAKALEEIIGAAYRALVKNRKANG